ncbi:MAG: MlaD family protein [Candidatus Methylopumilus sp.]|jgi:phospholipid/cholesterol/gamma-HCH transport system substrate-binding protein
MENRAHAIAVGLFTILLGLASIFAYWWLSGSRQELAEYTVVSPLPVTGLSPESGVKFRGVDVGKVTQIAFAPDSQTSIRITIVVTADLQLSKEAYAELRMQGITGLAYIDLNDESNGAVKLEEGAIIPLRPSVIDQLMKKGPQLISQMETLIANTTKLSESASQLVANIDGQKLNRMIDHLEKASAKVEPTLKSASVMFNNVSKMASEKNQRQLTQTLQSLQQTSDEARPMMDEMSSTAKQFREVADQFQLNTSQLINTLDTETLPQIHLLTQTLNHEAKHFDSVIDLLEDHPQSLIFGKPTPQPGPGEAGFTNGKH